MTKLTDAIDAMMAAAVAVEDQLASTVKSLAAATRENTALSDDLAAQRLARADLEGALESQKAENAALHVLIDELMSPDEPAPEPNPTPAPVTSVVPGGGTLVDAAGVVWLVNAAGQVVKNGVVDASTSGVVEGFLFGGLFHQRIAPKQYFPDGGIWSFNGSWVRVDPDPRGSQPSSDTLPPSAPTPPAAAGFWGKVLRSHGFNSDLNRAWNDAELEGFAKSCSSMRAFGFARPAPYSAFANDTQNIDLIERAMRAGLPVLYCPFTKTKYDGKNQTLRFPAISETAAVAALRDRAVDIAGVAKQRGWPLDMFCFEIGNEPTNPAGMASTYSVYQVLVNAIREVNPDLYLAAMGNGLEGSNGWELYYKGWLRTGPLKDPRKGENRISHGHHHYDPMRFTHQGCDYKEGGVLITKQSVHYPLSTYGKAQMRASMKEFADWGAAAGVQIHVGEMMATGNAPSLAERLAYAGDFFDVARELAIPTHAWNDDNSANATLGGGWFPIMAGTKGAAVIKPEWSALLATAGA